jgi:predicted SnoaL-like aldol condensation-catalyzing enzyme
MFRRLILSASTLLASVCLPAAPVLAASARPLTPAAVVTAFSRLLEQHHALEAVDRYVAADFIEHDSTVAGGDRAGLIQYLERNGWTDSGHPPTTTIHRDRLIASGPYVVILQHLRRAPGNPTLVFVDIFRVERGRIVEHWDVMEPVPAHPANTRHKMY